MKLTVLEKETRRSAAEIKEMVYATSHKDGSPRFELRHVAGIACLRATRRDKLATGSDPPTPLPLPTASLACTKQLMDELRELITWHMYGALRPEEFKVSKQVIFHNHRAPTPKPPRECSQQWGCR